ncbi:hypothetical protein BJF79_17010 [Actinomadura sp. CNU-125]|nr:hypothetical protein BJF79_17010 [Actinomadura sp. CNU-125]
MYASSSDALCVATSCSGMPCAAARSPISATSSPVTVSASPCPVSTRPPAAARTAVSSSGRGERTRTPRANRSASSRTDVSAISRPRPTTTSRSAVSSISLIRWLEISTVRPSAARDRVSSRIQRTPSGSRPFTGSSNSSTPGSPSSAAAIPSRCRMPSEKPATRLRATPARPTSSSTSAARRGATPLLRASQPRWSSARRPPCTAPASSSAPTSNIGRRTAAYRPPFTSASPDEAASRPSSIRMVVDFPAPFGPRNPVTVPGRTVNDRPSTAVVAP